MEIPRQKYMPPLSIGRGISLSELEVVSDPCHFTFTTYMDTMAKARLQGNGDAGT